jgi:hypothetical protein
LLLNNSFISFVYIAYFFFFSSPGVQTQHLVLAKQALYHLILSPSLHSIQFVYTIMYMICVYNF